MDATLNASMSILKMQMQMQMRIQMQISYGLLLRLTKGLRTAITSQKKID